MQSFEKEFRTIEYIISKSDRVLFVAHSRPDPDAVGSNSALAEYVRMRGKHADIACLDPFPEALSPLLSEQFFHPDQLDLGSYDAVIACDSVDRGFDKIVGRFSEDQAVVLIDHHPDISVRGDVIVIDTAYSSSSELAYLFLRFADANISKSMATKLLMGIVFDTGGFQHGSMSPRVMEIASDLMKRGAPLTKISQTIFAHQNISALKLWGKAFEKAKLNPENGMLVTAVTKRDAEECQASIEDIYQVASILSAVPDAKFAMVLSEREGGIVRASLRSMEQHGVDVSAIASQFGGGGHRLASGFEIPGKIIETERGFAIA